MSQLPTLGEHAARGAWPGERVCDGATGGESGTSTKGIDGLCAHFRVLRPVGPRLEQSSARPRLPRAPALPIACGYAGGPAVRPVSRDPPGAFPAAPGQYGGHAATGPAASDKAVSEERCACP